MWSMIGTLWFLSRFFWQWDPIWPKNIISCDFVVKIKRSKQKFFPMIRSNFHCRHFTYLLCFARVRVEWVDSEHCSQRWVPQVVQYTTAKWLSFSSQQTDNSRSRSKNVGEKLAGSKLFPAFCSEACNRSINSINAKFFFKSQTPFGPRKRSAF